MDSFDMDKQLEDAFRKIDRNGDGFLTPDEIGECLEKFGFRKDQTDVSGRLGWVPAIGDCWFFAVID